MGQWGKGVTLTLGTAVAQLTNVAGLDLTAETYETQTHDTADDFKTYVGGWIDGGELSFEGNVKDKAQMDIIIDKMGTVVSDATITLPLAKVMTITFDCVPTALSIDGPQDGLITFSGTLKVSGEPVVTEAA